MKRINKKKELENVIEKIKRLHALKSETKDLEKSIMSIMDIIEQDEISINELTAIKISSCSLEIKDENSIIKFLKENSIIGIIEERVNKEKLIQVIDNNKIKLKALKDYIEFSHKVILKTKEK